MRQNIQRIIPALLLMFLASCVQLASDEVAPTQVGNAPTWTPIPTETEIPLPTETPAEPVAATEEVIDDSAAVATTDEAAAVATEEALLEPTDPVLQFATQTPIPTATDIPTDTPSPTATFTVTPSPSPTLTATATEAVSGLVQEGTAIAQDDVPAPVDDPVQEVPAEQPGQITDFEASATAIIANATQTEVVALTQTAAAIIGGPTEVPSPTGDPGLGAGDPGAQPTAVPPVAPGADCVHEVRTQDQNLYRLSLAYGVPIRSITNENGTALANPNLITLGQRLRIPGCGTTGGVPPATSTPGPVTSPGGGFGSGGVVPPNGDCTWGTTVQFPNGCPGGGGANTSGSIGTGADTGTGVGTGGPGVGTTPGRVVIVEQGDTLSSLALQYGTTAEAIAAANGIGIETTIFFNQELIIP